MEKPLTKDDFIVGAVCGLIAIPICEASWHAIVVEHDATVRVVVGLAIGLPIGLMGLSFHWWKDGLLRHWVQRQTTRWWPAIALLSLLYLLGPNIYQRALDPDGIRRSTGRIVWNFEQTARGAGWFLTLQRTNDQEIRFINFGAHGKNTSTDPITQFSGYVRSDLTNAQLPIYLLAQNAGATAALACFANPWIPTLPEDTFGIPPLADFDITTFDKFFIVSGKDGIPISSFLNNFGAFTVVLEYDGMTFQRHFSIEEIKRQIDLFERSLNPKSK